jgi:alcohol dehydrogenase YqhD (iron-dependent ADH family)
MEKFEFYNPVRVVFGPGELKRVGPEAKAIGQTALLVSYKSRAPEGGAQEDRGPSSPPKG